MNVNLISPDDKNIVPKICYHADCQKIFFAVRGSPADVSSECQRCYDRSVIYLEQELQRKLGL